MLPLMSQRVLTAARPQRSLKPMLPTKTPKSTGLASPDNPAGAAVQNPIAHPSAIA